MQKNPRSRNWSLVCYLTKQELLQRLCANENVRYYAFIVHDKDTLPDGSAKPLHVHLALCLNSARTAQQICHRFTDITSNAGNCFGQPTRSNKAIFEYFTHSNQPDKYQYSEIEIISNNIDYFKNDEKDEDNTILILNDILQGKPLRELVKIYGRELLYHYSQFKEVANDILEQETPKGTFLVHDENDPF